jgi:uncharacterized phage-like protein YoqJ
MTIYAMTGHRHVNPARFAIRLEAKLTELQPTAFIQGMAEGADLLAGKIAIDMGIPVISAMPWPTHYKSVDADWLDLYRWVRDHSVEVYPVTEVDDYPGPWVYHKRNYWMVDEADKVLAWWDGREGGGTYQTVKYANKKNKVVVNAYSDGAT